MVEDPWAELEAHAQYSQEDTGSSWPHNAWEVTTEGDKEEEQQMSESMIAQVGDTLCERNERLLEDTTATPDTSTLDPPEHNNSDSPVQEPASVE